MRQFIVVILIALLSGCATHRQPDNFSKSQQLNRLMPHYAAIPNGRIEYYRFGKGTPIVLVSGYLSDVTTWNKDFLAALAKNHQVIVFNNRNVSGSFVEGAHYNSKDLARDTYYLMESLHLKNPSVLGISMGGMIAQQVAALYPDKINSLILINTAISGKQSVRPSTSIQQIMLNMPMSKIGRYFVAVKLYFPSSDRTRMGIALITKRFKPAYYTENDSRKIIEQQKELILQWGDDNDTARKLKRIKVPVLILNGKVDDVIPPINSEILANTFTHSQLKRWPNGGHAMIYQYPNNIADVINNWLT